MNRVIVYSVLRHGPVSILQKKKEEEEDKKMLGQQQTAVSKYPFIT